MMARTVRRWLVPLFASAVLLGCAVPEWQKPGTPAAELLQSMGQPTLRVPLADGAERWLYSRQPMGQQVYHLVFDDRARLVRVDQVLVPEHFNRLRVGEADRQQVLNYFGPAALVERVSSFRGDIWTYRFHENGADRQAHVFLDPQGIVQRVMYTDELRRDDDSRL